MFVFGYNSSVCKFIPAQETLKCVLENVVKQTWKGRELISDLLTDGNAGRQAPKYSKLITTCDSICITNEYGE